MKKYLWLFLVTMCLFAVGAHAADVVDPNQVTEVPSWLKAVLDLVSGLPYVGVVVVEVLKWTGLVAGVMTALATCIMTLSLALQGAGVLLGFTKVAETVKKYTDMIMPWLQYLSIYNVQKKPPVQK